MRMGIVGIGRHRSSGMASVCLSSASAQCRGFLTLVLCWTCSHYYFLHVVHSVSMNSSMYSFEHVLNVNILKLLSYLLLFPCRHILYIINSYTISELSCQQHFHKLHSITTSFSTHQLHRSFSHLH